ncbi:D-2-hydroxyacid dehydrogenase [Sphingomonas sp. SUN039]|uniref:D-2-hydroxyacid dehydrogenase n=1 Tax=Sphingomonas sp. SUN039 TaxID=2937787 RepID=UPI002164CA13|nr:D-2-hydroxyacid dehydrogenase [Sphingomonas sp. SUN039]UVO53382.1 D-2-hydroxyacid dehydrogenase [Sphingomonas sp. SUN039]
MTFATLPALVRPLIESRLPDWLTPRWFATKDEAIALAADAEIGWFDFYEKPDMAAAIGHATAMRWLHTLYAGVDGIPLDQLARQGAVLTNGAGTNAVGIAEYVVMGMLSIAKGYREVVRAQDRHEWLQNPPSKVELAGTRALLLGYGAIGQLLLPRLTAFGIEVSVVRRSPGPDMLGPDDWRPRLGEFDWVILAVPATPETDGMMDAAAIAAMKPGAVLLNIARGSVVDQDSLVEALAAKRIGGAFLDVTTPEPLPPEHQLWSLPNAHITMHLSGQAQEKMFLRGADRFLANLERWHRGEPLEHGVDLQLGY